MKHIIKFIKEETVLCAALALAAISSFMVPPDAKWAGYIDFRTLSLLFCLMTIMAGLREIGVFEYLAQSMLSYAKSTKHLVLIPVMLCFFMSMVITNDVALITFVPFTFTVLEMAGEKENTIIPVVAMQTTAANLGSMLTPVGNPQNLYLYGISGMGVGEFIMLMLPYTAVSLVIFAAWCLCRRGHKTAVPQSGRARVKSTHLTAVYLTLFVLSLLTVARVIPYPVTLAAVVVTVAACDRRTLTKVDYPLLFTFIGFFIFIGNIGRMEAFRAFLQNAIAGHEVITAFFASQIISNVPAALLLSGFTDKIGKLIIGTNIGGLGTLIASMASLISFKYIARWNKSLRGRYILYFTVVNVIFAAALLGMYFCLR